MRMATVAVGFALAAGLAAFLSPEGRTEDGPEVAAMFRERCAGCHPVPDPALRTDRAWIDQVHRTA